MATSSTRMGASWERWCSSTATSSTRTESPWGRWRSKRGNHSNSFERRASVRWIEALFASRGGSLKTVRSLDQRLVDHSNRWVLGRADVFGAFAGKRILKRAPWWNIYNGPVSSLYPRYRGDPFEGRPIDPQLIKASPYQANEFEDLVAELQARME